MGMSSMQVQPSTQPQGKGGMATSAQPKSVNDLYTSILGRQGEAEGLNYWNQRFGDTIEPAEIEEFRRGAQPELQSRQLTATSGQPQFGMPNMYSNTIRPWDNASIMGPNANFGGKGGGKGGGKTGSSYGYPVANTNIRYTPPNATTGRSTISNTIFDKE